MMHEEKKMDDAAMAPTVVLPVNIKNLTFSYDSNKQPNIVGLNCVVQPNSKVILVGANGAGKSTLIFGPSSPLR
jgi:ABC-type bacteriocin/lantibiotic exporter with double-glycine peptidase domain